MQHLRPAIGDLPPPIDSNYRDLADGFAWAILRAARSKQIRNGGELARVVNYSLREIAELDGIPEVDSFCYSFAGMVVRDALANPQGQWPS